MTHERNIQPVEKGHAEKHRDPDDPDSQFEEGVHAQRMRPRGNQARQDDTPQKHAPHVGSQEDAERYRGRPDHQLQHLEPDNFIYQGGTAAADEQRQQEKESPPARRRRIESCVSRFVQNIIQIQPPCIYLCIAYTNPDASCALRRIPSPEKRAGGWRTARSTIRGQSPARPWFPRPPACP